MIRITDEIIKTEKQFNNFKRIALSHSDEYTWKGVDLDHIFYVKYNNNGAPSLGFQKIGEKGVKYIEITSMGNLKTSKIKSVRVRGESEEGEPWEIYIKDAFISRNKDFFDYYETQFKVWNNYIESEIKYLKHIQKQVYHNFNKYDRREIVGPSYSVYER